MGGEIIHSVLVREAHEAHDLGQKAPRYTAEHAFSEVCIEASHKIEAMIEVLKMVAWP